MAAREEKEEKEEDGEEEERNRSRLICSPVKVPRLPRARFPMAVRIGCAFDFLSSIDWGRGYNRFFIL